MEGIIVLVGFTVAFVGIVVWIYLPRNKERINSLANIPFHEDDHHGR